MMKGGPMSGGETQSLNDIRTAIRELTVRAQLARKEGRPDDAAELDRRSRPREELGARPDPARPRGVDFAMPQYGEQIRRAGGGA